MGNCLFMATVEKRRFYSYNGGNVSGGYYIVPIHEQVTFKCKARNSLEDGYQPNCKTYLVIDTVRMHFETIS